MPLKPEPPYHYRVTACDLGTWTQFLEFWEASPKTGSRKRAWQAFLKLRPGHGLFETILQGLAAWRASSRWQEEGGRYICDMRTWIAQARWENPPPRPSPFDETVRRLMANGVPRELALERAVEILAARKDSESC